GQGLRRRRYVVEAGDGLRFHVRRKLPGPRRPRLGTGLDGPGRRRTGTGSLGRRTGLTASGRGADARPRDFVGDLVRRTPFLDGAVQHLGEGVVQPRELGLDPGRVERLATL